jgi:hypothetical protein
LVAVTDPTGDALRADAENLKQRPKKVMPVSPGRPKGVPNKTTQLLKDAILKAATDAGNGDMAAYLEQQAKANPGPFMALLGKVLPMQVTGEGDGPLRVVIQRFADE